jgi:hypothetical protein
MRTVAFRDEPVIRRHEFAWVFLVPPRLGVAVGRGNMLLGGSKRGERAGVEL